MTKNRFITLMNKFKEQYDTADTRLNKIYDALGADCVEAFCDISYENLLIQTLAAAIDENRATEIVEDLSFLLYECDFNLATYQERTFITKEDGTEAHPIITTFEDYYDFLKGV